MTPNNDMSVAMDVAPSLQPRKWDIGPLPYLLKTSYSPLPYHTELFEAQFQAIPVLNSVHRKELLLIWIRREGGIEEN